jgi:hypothetical protein
VPAASDLVECSKVSRKVGSSVGSKVGRNAKADKQAQAARECKREAKRGEEGSGEEEVRVVDGFGIVVEMNAEEKACGWVEGARVVEEASRSSRSSSRSSSSSSSSLSSSRGGDHYTSTCIYIYIYCV